MRPSFPIATDNTDALVAECGRILEGSTMKLPTTEHVLALRNVIAGAYKLLHEVQHGGGEIPMGDIMAWKRRANAVLDARVK